MSDARSKNWAGADVRPSRVLDDICLVDWKLSPESFRRERAAWLRSVRCVGDVRLSNMVWLLHVLAGFMKHENDTAWPSIPRLAAELNWSEPTVKRALAQAIEWGWLVRERRYDKSNRYSMSFSRSVRAELEERHSVRIAPFDKRGQSGAASDKDTEAAGHEIKPDLTVGSNLISPSDQIRSHPEIKPDPLYRLEIPSRDPIDPYRAGRLGETEQEESLGGSDALGHVVDDARLHRDVHLALGGGDIELGRMLADAIGRQQVDRLKERVRHDGVVGAADELSAARARARRLLQSKVDGASHVVA